MATLDHAASGGHRRGARDLQRGSGLGNTFAINVADSLLNTDAPTYDAAVFEALGDSLVRTFVLFPYADLGVGTAGTACDLLAGAVFFKSRAYIERLAFYRKDHGKQAFAQPPVNVREVHKRGTTDEHDGVKLVFGHQMRRAVDSLLALLDANGRRLGAPRFQAGDGSGQPLRLFFILQSEDRLFSSQQGS